MATAHSKPAAKAANKTPDQPKALKSDPQFPELHPDRHSKDGMQELPTGGTVDANPTREPAGGGAGAMQAQVDPQPSIGVRHDEDKTSRSIATVDDDAEHVFSYEQALTLPVVDSGTPVKMPTDAQLKAMQKKQADEMNAAARRRNDRKAADDKSADEPEDAGVAQRKPVIAFKDRDRRTMVVVRAKDGSLGAMPSKEFKDVEAPNAA